MPKDNTRSHNAGENMGKMIDVLKIVETSSPMPNIELDIKSLKNALQSDIIERALARIQKNFISCRFNL